MNRTSYLSACLGGSPDRTKVLAMSRRPIRSSLSSPVRSSKSWSIRAAEASQRAPASSLAWNRLWSRRSGVVEPIHSMSSASSRFRWSSVRSSGRGSKPSCSRLRPVNRLPTRSACSTWFSSPVMPTMLLPLQSPHCRSTKGGAIADGVSPLAPVSLGFTVRACGSRSSRRARPRLPPLAGRARPWEMSAVEFACSPAYPSTCRGKGKAPATWGLTGAFGVRRLLGGRRHTRRVGGHREDLDDISSLTNFTYATNEIFFTETPLPTEAHYRSLSHRYASLCSHQGPIGLHVPSRRRSQTLSLTEFPGRFLRGRTRRPTRFLRVGCVNTGPDRRQAGGAPTSP